MKAQQTAITAYSAKSRLWDLSRKSLPTSSFEVEGGVSPQKIPVWLFVADGKRLVCRRPVEVTIREEDGVVLVDCDRLHVFASGETYDEAVTSFHSQVLHFFEEYSVLGDDEVIGRAAEIRRLYRDYFEVE